MNTLELYCQAIDARRAEARSRTTPPEGRVELVSPYTDDSVTAEQLALARKTQILRYDTGLKSQKKSEKYYRAVMGNNRQLTRTNTAACPL